MRKHMYLTSGFCQAMMGRRWPQVRLLDCGEVIYQFTGVLPWRGWITNCRVFILQCRNVIPKESWITVVAGHGVLGTIPVQWADPKSRYYIEPYEYAAPHRQHIDLDGFRLRLRRKVPPVSVSSYIVRVAKHVCLRNHRSYGVRDVYTPVINYEEVNCHMLTSLIFYIVGRLEEGFALSDIQQMVRGDFGDIKEASTANIKEVMCAWEYALKEIEATNRLLHMSQGEIEDIANRMLRRQPMELEQGIRYAIHFSRCTRCRRVLDQMVQHSVTQLDFPMSESTSFTSVTTVMPC